MARYAQEQRYLLEGTDSYRYLGIAEGTPNRPSSKTWNNIQVKYFLPGVLSQKFWIESQKAALYSEI